MKKKLKFYSQHFIIGTTVYFGLHSHNHNHHNQKNTSIKIFYAPIKLDLLFISLNSMASYRLRSVTNKNGKSKAVN